MDDNAEVFIDPEEDEVFFYDVTERESAVKSVLENKMQCETEKINESCSNQNDHASKDIQERIQSEKVQIKFEPTTSVGFEQITDLNWLSNSSNLHSKNENIADKCSVTATCQESFKVQATKDNLESPKKQNPLGTKKLDLKNDLPTAVNICIDHSYFIPEKIVIDKTILKTPKSVVKADKDGGFLKVLSEIALVKAEVDENNLGDIKVLTDISSAEELNDDDKENKQTEIEKANVTVKQVDVSPAKLCHNLIVNKGNGESQKKIPGPCEKVNEEHVDFFPISDVGNNKIAETVSEQVLRDEKRELESFKTDTVDDPVDELCMVKSLSLKDVLNGPNIAFEKPNDNFIYNESIKEREATEKISNTENLKELDNLKGKSYEESIILKESEDLEGICASENDFLKKKSGISPIPKLILPEADADVGTEGKDDSYFSVKDTNSLEKERHKKFVRRNTMRLLEELNELVTFGQAKRESLGTECNSKLSEEAAKVIQKLKAVGFDDSICSPEQYFDLDKLDSSVFNTEISDILNDTLSKPLSHVTSKDVESLLEKITANSLEVESDDEFNSRKEDSNNVIMNKNFMNEAEKSTNDHQKSSDSKAEQWEEIFKNENHNSKCGIPAQCESTKNVKEGNSVLSGDKKIMQKSILPPQTVETRPKVFRSVEKNYRGLTRIPKLVSTTSKVPVTAKEVKQHSVYPVPNTTPFLKAQKSLKFNNNDNAVSTNVNSKIQVTYSSGKGKAAAKDNTKMKSVIHKSNARNLFPKSETKINSEFHRLKSAVPLKGNSTESHLTKTVQKVPKVLSGSDSPVVATKYGGSVQRTIPKKP